MEQSDLLWREVVDITVADRYNLVALGFHIIYGNSQMFDIKV